LGKAKAKAKDSIHGKYWLVVVARNMKWEHMGKAVCD
jgi:hypothetical protein